jgi:hypothetical protein
MAIKGQVGVEQAGEGRIGAEFANDKDVPVSSEPARNRF